MDGRQRIMYNAPTAQRPATPQLEQISSEIFTLMYGSIVRQLIADLEDLDEVNKQLEKMGYNIGIRLVDEFLAKARISRCNNFKETMEVIGKQAFFMFLGIQASVTNWSPDGMECTLMFTDNPLTEFVELPESIKELRYVNMLCGVLRGALEMVSMDVDVAVVGDMLKGQEAHQLRVRLREHRDERFPYKEDD